MSDAIHIPTCPTCHTHVFVNRNRIDDDGNAHYNCIRCGDELIKQTTQQPAQRDLTYQQQSILQRAHQNAIAPMTIKELAHEMNIATPTFRKEIRALMDYSMIYIKRGGVPIINEIGATYLAEQSATA